MKRILMLVYAACAMLVIAGSLLWFVFTLRSDSLTGKAEALNSFKAFAQHTAEILVERSDATDSARLQIRLEQLCRNYRKYVHTVLIRDSAGVLFTWPQKNDIFSYTDQRVVEVKNMPLFFTAAQMHIPVQTTGDTVTVHAALQTLPVETIYSRGQVVFFLLLFIVLMTIMALIFSYVELKPIENDPRSVPTPKKSAFVDNTTEPSGKAADSRIERHEPQQPAEKIDREETPAIEAEMPAADVTDSEPTSVSAEFAQQPKAVPASTAVRTPQQPAVSTLPLSTQLEALNRLHIYDSEPSGSQRSGNLAAAPVEKKNGPNIYPVVERTPEADTVQPPKTAEAESSSAPNNMPSSSSSAAQDLYAESYGSFEKPGQPTATEPALDSETPASALHRTASLSDMGYGAASSLEQATLIEELTTALTETAVAEEDLALLLIHADDIPHNQQIIHLLRATLDRIHKVFVFNQDTLGLVIFYAPLDQAMQIANSLYDEIYPLLEDANKKSLGIGLTTRAGRLIPAYRMIEEAAAAIDKATQEGGDPIVAFRVNPDKYRRCLARLS